MLKKLECYIITSDSVKEFVKEAERMVREYGWEDRNVHPYGFPMKVTKIISDLKDYDKCTRGSKEYLVDMANGLADIINKWEEQRANCIWVRLTNGKKRQMDRDLAEVLAHEGLCAIIGREG